MELIVFLFEEIRGNDLQRPLNCALIFPVECQSFCSDLLCFLRRPEQRVQLCIQIFFLHDKDCACVLKILCYREILHVRAADDRLPPICGFEGVLSSVAPEALADNGDIADTVDSREFAYGIKKDYRPLKGLLSRQRLYRRSA